MAIAYPHREPNSISSRRTRPAPHSAAVNWVEAVGMDERRALRASDTDREAAVERLRAAMNEGRLNLHEYDDRMARAYQAVTYGELADLFVDLPYATSGVPANVAGKAVKRAPQPIVPEATGLFAALPTTLRVLWTIWVTVVSINLVVWVLVSVSQADLAYFWPMWVIGPPGAALFGLSLAATAVRRGREARRREITG